MSHTLIITLTLTLTERLSFIHCYYYATANIAIINDTLMMATFEIDHLLTKVKLTYLKSIIAIVLFYWGV